MRKAIRPLALLTVVLVLLAGCRKNTEATGDTTPVQDAPLWSLLGGRMENFAANYEDTVIIALEYTSGGEAPEAFAISDPEVIDAVFEALNGITVVRETTDYVSGSDDSFVFVSDAGDRYAVRFNGHNLDAGSIYLIEHDAPLWTLAQDIRAQEAEKAAAAAAEAEAERQSALLPAPEPAPIDTPRPADETDEPGESDRIYSETQDFSIEYDPALRAEITDTGAIRLYASPRDDMSYAEVRRLDNGPDAQEYLEEQLSDIQTTRDEVLMQSIAVEQVDIVGLDLYGIWANYVEGDDYVSMASYAENIRGGILVYTAYFLEDTAETVLNALETALLTAEYGMNNAMRVPAEDAAEETAAGRDSDDAPAGQGGEGRWAYTLSPLRDGGTEYEIGTLLLDIPAGWEGKYFIEYGEDAMTFYHTASHDRWMEDYGFGGGMLFILGYSEDYDSIAYLPSYEYLGSAGDGGHYFLEFPTDVQGYYDDEQVMAEYSAMYADIDYVRDNSRSLISP